MSEVLESTNERNETWGAIGLGFSLTVIRSPRVSGGHRMWCVKLNGADLARLQGAFALAEARDTAIVLARREVLRFLDSLPLRQQEHALPEAEPAVRV